MAKKDLEVIELEPVDAPQPEASPPVPPAPEEPPIDAVIVRKVIDQTGAISTEIILNGKVQPTEVQTLLELGVKGWRKQIGLSE